MTGQWISIGYKVGYSVEVESSNSDSTITYLHLQKEVV